MSDIKILDLLSPTAIVAELKATTKKGALEELVGVLAKEGKVQSAELAVSVLLEREKLGSTGIGQGIAIPHAKTDQAKAVVAAFGVSKRGVAFESLDGDPVHLIFLLVAPPNEAAAHLKALARVSRMLKDKFFRQSLREAKGIEELQKLIREEDRF